MGEPIDQNKLNDLIDACWAHHAWVKTLGKFKANYSSILPVMEIPILWFGNLDKYFESNWKIITVGLNPSEMEFRESDDPKHKGSSSDKRFPDTQVFSFSHPLSDSQKERYRLILDTYFQNKPYWNWFAHWRSILSELEASHDGMSEKFTALHVDICTPLATSKPWSRLDPAVKKTIVDNARSKEISLWRKLMEFLRPSLVLMCVGQNHLEEVASFSGIQFSPRKRDLFCNLTEQHNVDWGTGNINETSFTVFNTPPEKRYPWTDWSDTAIKEISRTIKANAFG